MTAPFKGGINVKDSVWSNKDFILGKYLKTFIKSKEKE